MKLSGTKKKFLRKHILQQARELYLHPQTDAAITGNLKQRYPGLTPEIVREAFNYLAGKKLAAIFTPKNRLSIQITPGGIDVLDGAVTISGVEPSSSRYARLGYKKELRRVILLYCCNFHEFFNEDAEIHAEFIQSGFSNLLLEEVRFHIWYLAQKSLLELKRVDMDGDLIFMARITPQGMDVIDGSEINVGVSHEAR
ncbi:MAG: hypothetical protein IEMM0002_0925 [bacterium]|nr:MAG: hypothetical protein IEMM0002_0925 [bacterium]